MKIKRVLIVLMVLAGVLAVTGGVQMFADPGDESDPLVTLSYIEDVLMARIEALVGTAKTESAFQVVDLKQGDVLLCDAGTELVLRMGAATVIATEKGGLANVTAGYDLANGTAAPSNSHLIVPLGDGRGLVANTDAIVLIKGGYTIE